MSPKIVKPGEVTIEQLTDSQKLLVAIGLMQEVGAGINALLVQVQTMAQSFYNTIPCGRCGVKPENNSIYCTTCQPIIMEERAAKAQPGMEG